MNDDQNGMPMDDAATDAPAVPAEEGTEGEGTEEGTTPAVEETPAQ